MQIKGIDISEHNTRRGRVDFRAAKSSGKADFAMIRLGWAGYDGVLNLDENFISTCLDAQDAGVDIGVYVYAYTRTPEAARRAARETLAAVAGLELAYPVAFDVEETADPCLLSQGKTGLTDTTIAFLREIEAGGYYAMWYSYTSFAQQHLDLPRLASYDFWLADYRKTPWEVQRGIWQWVGDKGSCPGVTGPCDQNIAYKDYPGLIRAAGLNGPGRIPTGQEDWRALYQAAIKREEALEADRKVIAQERDSVMAKLEQVRQALTGE